MPNYFRLALDKAREFWFKLNRTQRVFVAGLTVLVLAVFAGFVFWLSRPDFRILYTKLSPEDANRVVNVLQAEKIGYKLADNGTTVNASSFGLYSIVTFTLIPAAISTPGTGFRRRRIRYN